MSKNFKPLKIELALSNLLIPSMPMHLDDLLAAAAVNEVMAGSSQEITDYKQIIDHLPLQKEEAGDNWVYQASVLNFERMEGKFMRPVSQRINKSNFALRRAEGTLAVRGEKLNLVSGPLKASIGLLPTAAKVHASAYCVGDPERIKALFGYLTHLGKKHNRGQGEILSLSIDEDASATEGWRRRFLPLALKAQALEVHAPAADIATRPPYWKNTHSVALGLPFSS